MPRTVRNSSWAFAAAAGIAAASALVVVLGQAHHGPALDRYLDFNAGDLAAEQFATDVGEILTVTLILALVTVVAGGVLAFVVRRPVAWARTIAWSTALVLALLVGTALLAGVDPVGATPGPDAEPAARLTYDLVPGWYPSVNAVVGLGLLIALGAAGFFVLRSSAADFYRAASKVEDPRWSSFVAERLDPDK